MLLQRRAFLLLLLSLFSVLALVCPRPKVHQNLVPFPNEERGLDLCWDGGNKWRGQRQMVRVGAIVVIPVVVLEPVFYWLL